MKTDWLTSRSRIEAHWPRKIQVAAAVPSLFIWTLLMGISVMWYAGVAVSAISGRLTTGDWRFPYLIVMLLFTLASSGIAARTLELAFQGRSRLWWHVVSVSWGLVLLALIGLVGD